MKIKYILCILINIILFSACKDKNSYELEGNIIGLNDPNILLITYFENETKIDTVYAQNGKFKYTSSYDSINPVEIKMENSDVWTTVWVENGQKIKISGDANYPELIETKGNPVNDLLTQFKQENRNIIEAKNNLEDTLKLIDFENQADIEKTQAQINALEQSLTLKAKNFIEENPSSIASLVLIQDYLLRSNDLGLLDNNLSLIQSPAKEDKLYIRLNAIYQKFSQTLLGSDAPDFSVIDIKGDTLTLNSFNDRYLILSFEKSGCGTCIEDYPVLKDLHKKYKRKNLEILSLIFDENKEDWSEVSKEYEITWLQSIDEYGLSSSLLYSYNISMIPDYFLIDKEGKILASHSSIKEITQILDEKLD